MHFSIGARPLGLVSANHIRLLKTVFPSSTFVNKELGQFGAPWFFLSGRHPFSPKIFHLLPLSGQKELKLDMANETSSTFLCGSILICTKSICVEKANKVEGCKKKGTKLVEKWNEKSRWFISFRYRNSLVPHKLDMSRR